MFIRPEPRSATPRLWLAVVGVFAVLITAACGTPVRPPEGESTTATAPTTPSPSTSPPSGTSPAGGQMRPTDKLLVIIEENRSTSDVARHMPYLTSVGQQYGSASHYYALAHPSLPNYLVIAGGSLFGVTDDEGPSAHALTGTSVFGELLAGGHTTKTYAEAMQGSCATENQGRYAVRHNPWTYFSDPQERAACAKYDIPAGTPANGQLVDDVRAGQLPTFGLVIPDICNDGHDCSAGTADTWLQKWLPALESGPDFASGRLAIVVTWDEDDGSGGNHIACVVIHPALQGRTVDTRLDHYALSAAISRLGGQTPLRDARTAPDLLHAFGLA